MSDINTCKMDTISTFDSRLQNLYDYLNHVAWLQANADEDQTVANCALDLLKVARDKIEADLHAMDEVCEVVFHRRCYDRDFPERCGETVSVEIVRVRQPGLKAEGAVAG